MTVATNSEAILISWSKKKDLNATYYSKDELIDYVKPYNMSFIEVDISAYLEQRIAASDVYQSQIPTFFYMASSFRELIRTYTLKAGEQQHAIERY